MRGLEQIVEDFVTEARGDTVGLWRIVNAVRHEFGEIEEDSVQATSIKAVEGLLNHGAGVVDYCEGRGWRKWAEEDAQTILARIKREWNALERDPNLGDVCWFSMVPMSSKYQEIQEITDSFLKEAEEDYIGLWQLIKEAKRFASTEEPLVIRAVTLDIVRELLAAGLEAGDPPYSATGYRPWPNQNPDAVASRIEQEWEALGHEPNIGDIVWFNFPEKPCAD